MANLLHYSGGFFGFLIFILDLFAIYEVLNSSRTTGGKALWVLLIFFFPIFGLVFYYFFSERKRYNENTITYQTIP
ncbi:hypothetical protein RclHR1_02510011 [Rhizophagus clarus]|uniref:Cardiolipin synthase N-terminal domain-containing protein n=1 Tax=Rhizophagus clarus TaxID=94130 RepID=A0A2Z6QYV9_9GLOM|nr:hypothetical protein RclHR1_02510011 [Rhizophagus clarus]